MQFQYDSGFRRCAFFAVLVLAYVGPALADEARLSPIRRTTIMTAAPEASLRFYRDLLGFSVEYDREVTDGGQLALISPGAKKGRAIALRQGAKLGGSVGLSWVDNIKPRATACDDAAVAGAAAMLILTDNLQAVYAKLRAAKVPFVSVPVTYDQTRGPTDAFTVFDPNCVRVAFAQIQNETFEQSINK
ncbi:MAG: VOC family protein [Rhodospirillaceae bacterium]|nr:VOC family protein [Rhodospirillaceae bacterium]